MCRACESLQRQTLNAARGFKPHQTAKVQAYQRAYYKRNAELIKARAVEWAKANPDKRREICRVNMDRQRKKLTNGYLRRMLAQGVGLKSQDIPQSLADAQKELLKLKRLINEQRG